MNIPISPWELHGVFMDTFREGLHGASIEAHRSRGGDVHEDFHGKSVVSQYWDFHGQFMVLP